MCSLIKLLLKVGVLLMATKENLIATAIKDSAAVFTADELLKVANITADEVKEIRNTAENNYDKAVREFLKHNF